MALTSAAGRDLALDVAVAQHLERGAGHLAGGALEAARDELRRALALSPREPRALGLLGQVHYRLGEFDEAAAAWQRLVDDNPVEAGARVNLGLACLKARRLPEAVRQLELAIDLQPGHQKAMGYLGLALLEAGDPARARGWFERAGSLQLVARCDELLAAEAALERAAASAPEGGAGGGASLGGAAATRPEEAGPAAADLEDFEVDEAPLVEEEGEGAATVVTEGTSGTGEPADAVLAGEAPVEASPVDPAEAESPQAAAGAPPAPAAGARGGVPTLADWTAARLLQPAPGEPFAAADAALAVAVSGDLCCRLDGLAAWRGELAFAGEEKRYRGRPTGQPFGEGTDQVHRVTGQGTLLLRARQRRFVVLDLAGDAAFFREPAVFGFEAPVEFENGRLTSPAGDLELVQLRGRGRVVLRTAGEPVAVEVGPEAPVKVPAGALLGWLGAVAPRLQPAPEGQGGGLLAELSGQGRALVDGGALEEGT